MSLLKPYARTGAIIPALLTLALLLGSCSSGKRAGGSSALDRAIESYIAGEYHDAVDRLEALARGSGSEEDLLEVYLYLGRSYMALGQHSLAIDAFAAGKTRGGGAVFDEYLRRLDVLVSGAPDVVATAVRVTRAQLAALIDRMFYAAPEDAGASAEGVVTRLESVRKGIVPVLPDGSFHGEAFVTRAAFYAAVARLMQDRGGAAGAQRIFDGGYDWALSGAVADTEADRYVSGREAVATLRRVSQAMESNGG
jgi:hypothetical protein